MIRQRYLAYLIAVASPGGLACSSDPVSPVDAGIDVVGPDVPADRPVSRSDGALNVELLEDRVFTGHCAIPSCHMGPTPTGRMNLEAGNVRASLVNVMAQGVQCGGTPNVRVVPGDVQASLIVHKLSDVMPPCGSRMPQGMAPLDPALIDLVRAWIDAGAP